MKKLLLAMIAVLACNVHAEDISSTFNSAAQCGSTPLPKLQSVISKDTPQIKFDLEVIKKENGHNSSLNHTIFSAFDNNYQTFSNVKTTTYIQSVTSFPNPSIDPLVVEKTPFIYTRTPGEITTGLSVIVLPKIVNDQIVTNICFSNSDLVALRKWDQRDMTIDMPEVTSLNSLQQIVLTSGKPAILSLSKDLDLKITAKKM